MKARGPVGPSPIQIILSPENWETKRQEGGEMVAVEIAPRVSIRMLKSEAIAKGLYPSPPAPLPEGEGRKRRKEGRNKMKVPQEDKSGG